MSEKFNIIKTLGALARRGMPTHIPFIPEGVLNSKQVLELHKVDVITRSSGKPIEVKYSSIDLHLSESGWKLKGSVKQKGRKYGEEDDKVEAICNLLKKEELKLDDEGLELHQGNCYVFKLDEYIDFSQFPWLYGEATGKSSVGRIDVLTRLIADSSPSYDKVGCEYRGALYVEIIPISLNVKIHLYEKLNQLRIHCGEPLPLNILTGYRLLFENEGKNSKLCDKAQKEGTLSVNLEPADWGGQNIVALRAKKDKKLPVIDLAVKELPEDERLDPHTYFETETVAGTKQNPYLVIKKDIFYILRSIERLALPEDIAVTGFAYTEHLGEVRIHYAGFAHPYFGLGRDDKKIGTPLIFEVRAHNFDVVLRHGETFARIHYYKMSKPIPEYEREPDVYSNQELKLSNYFREP